MNPHGCIHQLVTVKKISNFKLVGRRFLSFFLFSPSPLPLFFLSSLFSLQKPTTNNNKNNANRCSEDSWFPGYSWTILNCAGCGRHLGWRFTADDKGYYFCYCYWLFGILVILYFCILVFLYSCILVFLYSCILVFLYSCILVFLYSCILVFLYSCILVFLYYILVIIAVVLLLALFESFCSQV